MEPGSSAKKPVVVILFSSYGSGSVQARKRTSWLRDLFVHQKKLDVLEIDGTKHVEDRKHLWSVSGEKSYPQVFIRADGVDKYVGGYEHVHSMVETDTFWDTFKGCAEEGSGRGGTLTEEEAKAKEEVESLADLLEQAKLGQFLQALQTEGVTASSLREEAQDEGRLKALAERAGFKPDHVAELKRVLDETAPRAPPDKKRLDAVRKAIKEKDEAFFTSAFTGGDAKLNYDATIHLVMTEELEPVGFSKAVKGLMIADKTKWNIKLLKIILLPTREGAPKSPNTGQYGNSRNLINLLVVFAVKADKSNLMSYLKQLQIAKEDVPQLVGLIRGYGLAAEADYLESTQQSRSS